MKTYVEVKKRKPFDWNLFLNNAIKNKITDKEFGKAENLAGDFTTCACGNQCSIIDRDNDGEPKDHKLSKLGYLFLHNIEDKEFNTAKETLKKIEKRSSFLINQKVKEAKKLLSKTEGWIFKD